MKYESEQTDCPSCGNPCEMIRFGDIIKFLCDLCAEVEEKRMRYESRIKDCMAIIPLVIPRIYREMLKPELVRQEYLAALDYSPRQSFAIIGPSDTGKTRVAYHMLAKAAQMGLKPFAVTSMAFRRSVSDRSDESGKELIRAASSAQVLLIDDVGKGAATETADEALLELLTIRRDYNRTTYFTINGGNKWIIAKYGADFGKAIGVRIAHICGASRESAGRIISANQHI